MPFWHRPRHSVVLPAGGVSAAGSRIFDLGWPDLLMLEVSMVGRQREIAEIERIRDSRVITYVTGDRNPVAARIGDDAVRPFFDVLRELGPAETLDLFIYSRGGAIEVPWRIASALRQYAPKWRVLIPFRANSAATLLALGADEIVLGRHGELGPIDPILSIQHRPGAPGHPDLTPLDDAINVEDVMAYLRFVREQVGLTDQSALAESLGRLAERLDAVGLGSVYRTRSHIRDVAHRMLISRQRPPNERVMETIVETLASRVYAHGHAIGFSEARDIGLPVVEANGALEAAMWTLLCKYEDDLKLREPIDPGGRILDSDRFVDETPIAVVESTRTRYEFRGSLDIRAVRQMPSSLNVTLNLNLPLPPNVDPSQISAEMSVVAEQMRAQIQPLAQQAVNEALGAQAPVVGIDVKFRDGRWTRVDPVTDEGDAVGPSRRDASA
ncbi:MAG: hypothetical protein OXI48_13085 [bacterium]|nr:hypothetical protein [bacterium]